MQKPKPAVPPDDVVSALLEPFARRSARRDLRNQTRLFVRIDIAMVDGQWSFIANRMMTRYLTKQQGENDDNGSQEIAG